MIQTEKKSSSLEIGTRMVIPNSVLRLREMKGFWNPQNHPESVNEEKWRSRKPKGDIQSILEDIQSATSKRALGRILQRALETDLTTEERKQILTAKKRRRGQM